MSLRSWSTQRVDVHAVLLPYSTYIGSDNGLEPNRRQTIIWTNDGQDWWRIYASLGLNELTHLVLRLEYFSCWCPGSVHCQVISRHCIDYLAWKVYKNDGNHKYIFMLFLCYSYLRLVPQNHLGCLNNTIFFFIWRVLHVEHVSYVQHQWVILFPIQIAL